MLGETPLKADKGRTKKASSFSVLDDDDDMINESAHVLHAYAG